MDEINASISADGTVTFADAVPQFSKEQLDRMPVEAQKTSQELLEVERLLNASKEYLTKVRLGVLGRCAAPTHRWVCFQMMKHKDDAGWGPDEDMFSHPMGMGGGHAWAEDVSFM